MGRWDSASGSTGGTATTHDLGEQAGDIGLSRYSFGSKGRLIVADGSERVLRLAHRTVEIVGVNPAVSVGVIDPRVGPSATVAATVAEIGWIREEAGDRFEDLELHTRVMCNSSTRLPSMASVG
ncbi:MAG: hypothetical protein OXK79_13045 [Chloroflexota bacterium]|nr:hypothetical protein [Chloroflexota bacterium]